MISLFAFFVIRVDHEFFDLRPSGIHTHIGTAREKHHEDADHGERNKKCAEPDGEHHEHHTAEEQQQIASEAEDGEDRRIFDDLQEF